MMLCASSFRPFLYVVVVILMIVICNKGVNGIAKPGSSSSVISSGVGAKNPLTTDTEQCSDKLQQVQAAAIQLLSTQYEHRRGIDKLQMLVDHIQKDFTHIKSRVDDVDKYVTADKTRNSVYGERNGATDLHVKSGSYGSQPSSSLSAKKDAIAEEEGEQLKKEAERLKILLQQQTDYNAQLLLNQQSFNKSLDWVTSKLDNMTSQLMQETKRAQDLERKYKRLQRSLVETSHRVGQQQQQMLQVADSTGASARKDHDSADVEHFVNKQREINGNLQNRLRSLEQQVTSQSDAPAVSVQTGCPQSFFRHYTSCYKFENLTMNWIDAEKHCQTLHPHSHLVSIEKREEHDFIISYRNYNDAQWNSVYMWTGANDMYSEGNWVWVGTSKPVGFTFWRAGEPDNHNGDQHCMYLRADGGDSRWDDWHCRGARLTFVCEIVMTP